MEVLFYSFLQDIGVIVMIDKNVRLRKLLHFMMTDHRREKESSILPRKKMGDFSI